MFKDLMDYRKRGKGTILVSHLNAERWVTKLNSGKNKSASFK
ncbi:MAG: hypothetical protein ACI4NI_04890 [Candidatus Ornithospirochaeta sp.]